jgi:nitrate reductase assembly molybdenum cofactor insertion protein NarJ
VRAHYQSLAALFDYPGADYAALAERARRDLAAHYPAAAERLATFAAALPAGVTQLQEIFTRSFDVQAITTLSVGYLVFGDDYKRGELLANLGREHRAAGVDCGRELPDHLPNVLRLLAQWQDEPLRTELVEEILRPALRRMLAEFAPERMEERNRLYARHFRTLIDAPARGATMFREPLAALACVLDEDFPPGEPRPSELENDFLRSLSRELDLESGKAR